MPIFKRSMWIPAVVVAASLGLGAVLAEEGRQSIAGPTLDIVGKGGDVNAAGATVRVSGDVHWLAAAGANVTVTANVADGLNVAGADVSVNATVGGEIRVVGAKVEVRGHVARGAWLGGADVLFAGTAGGNVKAAGSRVTVDPASEIGGSLYAAGGDLTVGGHTVGSVNLAGSRAVFDGRADGNLAAEAQEFNIGPDAVINGDLVLVGATEATIAPTAKISGQTRHQPAKEWWTGPRVDPRPGQSGFGLFLAGTAILAGLGLLILGRSAFDEAASAARAKPGSRFVAGLVTIVLLPFAAGLLALTVIGIPLAIGLILLVPLLLIIGHATAALGIADWVLNREGLPRSLGKSLLYLAVGAIGISLVGLIPLIGPLAVLVTLLLGAGAFLAMLRDRLRTPRALFT